MGPEEVRAQDQSPIWLLQNHLQKIKQFTKTVTEKYLSEIALKQKQTILFKTELILKYDLEKLRLLV